MPELLQRKKERPHRLSVYAGWLDIANVAAPWRQSFDLTKFAALFYKWIVVQDGFFHCYGPLFDRLANDTASSAGVLPPVQNLRRYPLLALLRAGVIVPAIRQGDSMFENWKQERAGVVPGQYLNVKWSDGKDVLRLVDAAAKYYIPWPESLTPRNAGRRSRFAREVQRLFLSQASPYCVTSYAGLPKDLPHWFVARDLVVAEGLVRGFEDALRDADGKPNFRRGDVERYVASALKIPFRSYRDVVARMDWRDPYRTLPAAYGYYLLSVATSAYELMQAIEFDCVAGLFPLHDHPLLEEEQIYRALVPTSPGPPASLDTPLVFGSLDVSKLSVDRILAFRQRDAFAKYCDLLSATKSPLPGQSFWDANPEYVDYVRGTYVPAILAEFPSAGKIVTTTSAVADATSLVALTTAAGAEALEVAGLPVFRVLALTAGVLKTASWVPRIGEYVRTKRRQRSFERNNYALWRTRRQGATKEAAQQPVAADGAKRRR